MCMQSFRLVFALIRYFFTKTFPLTVGKPCYNSNITSYWLSFEGSWNYFRKSTSRVFVLLCNIENSVNSDEPN